MVGKPGTCSFKTCNNIPETGRKLCRRCADRANTSRYRRLAAGLCNNCNQPAIEGKKRCKRCGEWARAYAKANKSAITAFRRYQGIIYDYYGRVCVCCGETTQTFLTLDHINGRKNTPEETDRNNANFIARVARAIILGTPRSDIRVMCFNCNCGRYRNGGICPHQEAA